jgi:hypothetical protein
MLPLFLKKQALRLGQRDQEALSLSLHHSHSLSYVLFTLSQKLLAQAGLHPTITWQALEGDIDSLLSRSFGSPANLAIVREKFVRAADGVEEVGLPVWWQGTDLRYVQPMAILAATVPAAP